MGPTPRRTREEILRSCIPGCLLLATCGWPSAQERFPPPSEPLRILRTVPEAGADGVEPDATVDVCFSRPVDPRTLDDFDALISSGNLLFDTEMQLQLFPWRGPAGTTPGDTAWCPGSVVTVTPSSPLEAGILYRLQMRPAAGGWGGEVLETEGDGWILNEDGEPRFVVEFRIRSDASGTGGTGTGGTGGTGTAGTGGMAGTGGSTGGGDPAPAAVRLSDLFAAGRVFDPNADTCSCHTPDGPEQHAVAHERLDLSSPESAHEDLVQTSGVRETGFPMIAPRNPSESYLIHKLLRQEDGDPLHGVIGDAMPLEGELPYLDLVDLALWIEAGAEL